MDLTELLKGRTVNYMTDAKVVVQLVIESVEEIKHSQELEPSTRENDWWPATRDWTTLGVKFTNGHYKSYNSLQDIDVVPTSELSK
jgi:hypothetical protein